jgi:molybdopterin synthase sulfur carrier subunit
VNVEVRYFAAAREATGITGEALEVIAGSTVADLAEILTERHPALGTALHTVRFALDRQFVDDEAVLSDGAVLALIPPVGGG